MGRIIGLTFPREDAAPECVQCPHCEKTYATTEALAKHIKDKHPEQVQQ